MSDAHDSHYTVDEIIQHEDMAADAAVDKLVSELTKWRHDREHFMGLWTPPDDYMNAWKDEWEVIKYLHQRKRGSELV